MAKEYTVYVGWIGGKESDRQALESLGVQVGTWNQEGGCFDRCEVSLKALDRLDKKWSKYIWGLTAQTRNVEEAINEDIPF